jgi:putative NADH-flavin reductase
VPPRWRASRHQRRACTRHGPVPLTAARGTWSAPAAEAHRHYDQALVFTDSGELIDQALDQFGLPRQYAAAMRAHGDALNIFRTSNRLWTYFSPAIDTVPGERTSRFRTGSDQAVTDADGRSRISAEDAAVVIIDEAELPRFVQHRFTIGY